MTRLQGKVCVVTGATGMAADAARRFAEEGATVWVVDRDPDRCQALGLPAAVADLRDEAATEAAFASVCRAARNAGVAFRARVPSHARRESWCTGPSPTRRPLAPATA